MNPPLVKLLGIRVLLAVFVTGGCATSPVRKKSELSFVSEKQEIRMGSQQTAGG